MREAQKSGLQFLKQSGLCMSKEVSLCIASSRAANTWKAYVRWIVDWQSFRRKRGKSARYASTTQVANFLARYAKGKSVSQAASALSLFFSLHNVTPNPAAQKTVSLVCAAGRRLGGPTQRKKAMRPDAIRKLLIFLGKNKSVVHSRLACMIVFCWGGCLRIEECLGLNISNVRLGDNK